MKLQYFRFKILTAITIFPLFCLTVFASSAYVDQLPVSREDLIMKWVGNGLCVLSGLLILLGVYLKNRRARRRCTREMDGVCVSYKREPGKQLFTPVYEVIWKGSPIQIWKPVYASHGRKIKPAVGERVKLHVNPENPLEFYSKFDSFADKAPIMVGLFFIVLPFIFVIHEALML